MRKLILLVIRLTLIVILGVANSGTVKSAPPEMAAAAGQAAMSGHQQDRDGAWSPSAEGAPAQVYLPFTASNGGSGGPTGNPGGCLARPAAAWPGGKRIIVSGTFAQTLFNDIPEETYWGHSGESWKNLTSGYVFDFTGARWNTLHNQPFYLDGGANSCLAGLTIMGTRPYPAPAPNLITWDMFHSMAALGASIENVLIENVYAEHSGDGIRLYDRYHNANMCTLKSTPQDFILRDVHFKNMHDDCIENDWGHAGLVEDAFLDGCFTGLSSTPDHNCIASQNWAQNVWTVQDSLIYMKPLLYGYDANAQPIYANNVLIKDYANGPRFAFHGVTIRADGEVRGDPNRLHGYGVQIANDPIYGRLKLASCSGNTFVWLGPGSYPPPNVNSHMREALQELPDTETANPDDKCFRFTKDECVWSNAVAEWKTRHGTPTASVPCSPTFYTYP